jgi:DNA-binding NarL/FixJ family response regulator
VASHVVGGPHEWDDASMSRPANAITVLVVDDHAEFRAAAVAMLATEGFTVVGEAASGAEAAPVAARLHPDVVLLDIRLPDSDGIAIAEQLAQFPNAPKVVLVSSRDAATYGARLSRARARGFLAKSQLSGASLRALLR